MTLQSQQYFSRKTKAILYFMNLLSKNTVALATDSRIWIPWIRIRLDRHSIHLNLNEVRKSCTIQCLTWFRVHLPTHSPPLITTRNTNVNWKNSVLNEQMTGENADFGHGTKTRCQLFHELMQAIYKLTRGKYCFLEFKTL